MIIMKVWNYHNKMMRIFSKIYNLSMSKIKGRKYKKYNKMSFKILKIILFHNKIFKRGNKI